jgi:hypothetical protein
MARTEWNAARDATVRRLRAAGQGWPEIGAALGISADVARERGRRIGARRQPAPPPPEDEALDDPDRGALPAGHPRAWTLLTAGTVLAGVPWPGYAT